MNIREWTLPVYTILTQLSTGALLFIMIIRLLRKKTTSLVDVDYTTKIPILIIFITALFAIGFAHLHLSKPLLSFTAIRNIRTSWLSRELLLNIIYIILLSSLTGTLWLIKDNFKLKTILGWLTILAGFGIEYCMAHIYMIPSQPAWNTFLTPISFFFTTLLLGAMTVPVLLMMDLIFKKSLVKEEFSIHVQLVEISLKWLTIIAIIISISMSILIFFQTANLSGGSPTAQASLVLLMEIYQPLFILRLIAMFVGVGWSGITTVQFFRGKIHIDQLLTHTFTACLLVLVAEILGRFLFYAIHVKIGI